MRILVTGGKGFIGAWIVRRLLADGHAVRIFDLVEDRRLLQLVVGAAAEAVEWQCGDIVRAGDVDQAMRDCAGVIHMAGILTPDCAANPVRGAEINLIGTLNVFDAALRQGIERLVYTSSAGVFGPEDGSTPQPTTHYGAFKLACEGSARAYWADHGLASIGFRPFIVYGPGRETGLTAGPSLACKAAVLGQDYTIPYTGRAGLVFVEDVAQAYVRALLRRPDGAHVCNMVGEMASNEDVIAAIRRVRPNAAILAQGPPIPIAADVAADNLEALLPGLPATGLVEGVARTMAFWRRTTEGSAR